MGHLKSVFCPLTASKNSVLSEFFWFLQPDLRLARFLVISASRFLITLLLKTATIYIP